METRRRPRRIIRDPISPTGVPLWRCTQAARHDWIRKLANVPDMEVGTLMSRPEWPAGFEIDALPGFAPNMGAQQHFRQQWRERPDALGFWVVVERCRSYAEAVEQGFIIACETRGTRMLRTCQ